MTSQKATITGYLIFVLLMITSTTYSQKNIHSIIPEPVSYVSGKGHFILNGETTIQMSSSSKELSKLADYLNERLLITKVSVKNNPSVNSASGNVILLDLNNTDKVGEEGYLLTVNKKLITVRANTGKGIFYGIQTLIQLLPPEIETISTQNTVKKWEVPVCTILDYPRFQYRGMHLDVGRHLFPVEFIKKYIDLLAAYKINNFHWHLTEDQGWRLEIKKYPLLTEIGAWRKSSPIGRNVSDDNQAYGGFYTQAEAREIVAYAARRYVNVIPEIEMPGHAMAALAAYPQLSCTGGPFEVYTKWGVTDDIFCAGKEETFLFLEDVLNEVMNIFPSKYIHIGGDEAPKTRWESCSLCQKRMQDEHLKNAHELQNYFITRIEKFLNSNGRQIIGWDEILEGGLAPGATVMSWRGTDGGIAAAKLKHDVIMTPGSHCYFDHYQGNPATEPLAIGGFNTLQNVYSFEPVPGELTSEESKYIIGSQGNVWTEYMLNSSQVEYMAFPRALALAEVNWSARSNRNWDNFSSKMNKHFERLEKMQVNFSKSSNDILISTAIDPETNQTKVLLECSNKSGQIFYSIGNTSFKKYKKPFLVNKTSVVKAFLKLNKKPVGNETERIIYVHDGFGKTPVMNTQYNYKYAASGPFTLTDGLRAHPRSLKSDWLGFLGNNAEFIIDLGLQLEIKNINIGFLHNPSNWIYLPTGVEIELSTDGITYEPANGMRPELLTMREPITVDYTMVQINSTARYIKITAKNRGICPDDQPGSGNKAWLFMDEVMINSLAE